jgi:putative peptide zinc metalloprotease protein
MEQTEQARQQAETRVTMDQAALAKQIQEALNQAVPERPALAPDVQLVGKMQDSGFTQQQWLVERGGQYIQVTELLYRVASLCDRKRDQEEIAEAMTESTEWMVTKEYVHLLVKKLIPLGIVSPADGVTITRAPNDASTLRVNMRRKVLGPELINPIASVFQHLYRPPLLLTILLTVLVAHGWLYLAHGERLVRGFLSALYEPWQFFVVLGLMVLAGIFHELGHAAALVYGGGRVREAGIGLYLIYPVMFTDTSDSYRLGRWARVRTDLGGFYFYLIFAMAMMGLSLLIDQPFLLLTVVLINIDILYQLLPFVRFDGYWALADLTGIPDFFSQMKPFLLSLLPARARQENRLPNLKPWVKKVYIAYIALTLPFLALLYFFMIRRLPTFLRFTWASFIHHGRLISITAGNGDYLGAGALVVQMLLLALPLVGMIYMLYALTVPLLRALWRWSQPTPARQVTAVAIALAAIALLALLWTPDFSFAARGIPDGVQQVEVTGREHVEGAVNYTTQPPAGGDHAPDWQNCGYYSTPIRDENAVHSLEHGAVWITYRPDLPREQIQELRGMANSQTYVLVSPYPAQSQPIIASAWGYQLPLASVEDARLDQFVNAFRLGEGAPERGESCTGGIGETE